MFYTGSKWNPIGLSGVQRGFRGARAPARARGRRRQRVGGGARHSVRGCLRSPPPACGDGVHGAEHGVRTSGARVRARQGDAWAGAVGVGRGARRRLWRGASHPIGFWDVGWRARAARRRGPRARVRAGALGAWRPRVRRRRLWPPCARASARRGGRAGRGGCALPACGEVAARSCGRCAGRRSAVIGGWGAPCLGALLSPARRSMRKNAATGCSAGRTLRPR